MELTPVVCNNCGAPLQIPGMAHYVTCQHCQSQLEVKRNDSVAWTEKITQIEAIDRRTEHLVDHVAQLRYEAEVTRIDRAWEREQDSFMVRDQFGNSRRPSAAGGIVAGSFLVIAGFAVMFAGGDFLLGGPVMILGGIALGFISNQQEVKFLNAKRRYLRRRADVRLNDYRLDLQEHPEELTQNPFLFLPPAPGSGPDFSTDQFPGFQR